MSHPPRPQDDLERKEILESRIGFALMDLAPPGWRRVDLRASMTADTQQLQLAVLMDDGREAAASGLDEGVQRQIVEAMGELRHLLHRPDSGTWFSMRLGIKPDSYSVAYDFHHEPPWEPPLDPEAYVRDLETFPRDVMHIPDWLRGRLREARPGEFTGSVTVSGRMSMEDQRDWADEVAALLGQTLPPGNKQTTIYFQAMGHHSDMSIGVLDIFMKEKAWDPPPELIGMFEKLRAGMYQENAGTWFGVRLQIRYIASVSLEFDWKNEPEWTAAPPESAYREELELFPRVPEATPYWLARRAGLVAGPELRVAKPYDATIAFPGYPDGYPTFADRPTLSDDEHDGLLAYLENAPVVHTEDGGDPDLLAPAGSPAIPREYRTDGAWVWPATVAHYLRAHNVAPERGLVDHIRSQGAGVTDVGDDVREAAVAVLKGGSA